MCLRMLLHVGVSTKLLLFCGKQNIPVKTSVIPLYSKEQICANKENIGLEFRLPSGSSTKSTLLRSLNVTWFCQEP